MASGLAAFSSAGAMLPLRPDEAATKPAGARAWRSSAAIASSPSTAPAAASSEEVVVGALPRATACEAMKLTSVLGGVSLYILQNSKRGMREGGKENILILRLHAALDAQHLLIRILVPMLDLEALPLLPELRTRPGVAELRRVAVDSPRAVDFAQPPLHFGELEAHLLDALVELEDLLELLGDLGKTVHDVHTPLVLACTVLRQSKSEHDHADELGGVGLGGGDTDLGTGVDVDTAVGHERDAGADNVDDTNSQGATLQAVAESHEGVGSLTGLGDEDASVVTEDGSLTIEEVGCEFDGDGDLSQILESTANSHARVVGSTASDENQTSAAPDGADVLPKTTESHGLLLGVQATTHSVDDRLGLLEDLLLHEVVEAALHDLLELNLDGLDGTDVAGAVSLG